MLTELSTAFGVVGGLHLFFGVRIPLRDTLFRSLRSHCSCQPDQLSLPLLLHQARAGSVSLFSATFCASDTTRSLFIPFCSTDFCGCGLSCVLLHQLRGPREQSFSRCSSKHHVLGLCSCFLLHLEYLMPRVPNLFRFAAQIFVDVDYCVYAAQALRA